MAELEKAGLPTVAFVAQDFDDDWGHSAPIFGMRQLSRVVVPRPLVGLPAEDVYPHVNAVFDDMVQGLTAATTVQSVHPQESTESESIAIEGEDRYDALERMNEMFLDRGWSDGFPLWAPTRGRVDAMLKDCRREPHDIVAVLAPGNGEATVEKIAINAFMAGCKPAHMSLLIAAVQAISEPHFMLRNVAMSTGSHAPLMLVNGPIVKRLGINAGRCALGPGAPSAVNTVLGRALRLFFMNLGHAYPNVMDMDTLGTPNKYSMCLAENEEVSPWDPYHVEKGYERDASVVTVHATYAITEVKTNVGSAPEQVMNVVCSTACNQGASSVGYWLQGWRSDPQAVVEADEKHQLLVCPVHAEIFRKHGWSKQDIRTYHYRHARIAFKPFMANLKEASFRAARPHLQWLWDSPDARIPVLEKPECLDVIVAGAMGGPRSTYSYGAAEPVSKQIEE